MQCDEFEDRLNEVLDERRRPQWDDELRLHCEVCESCRKVAADYSALLDGFYAYSVPEPPADLALRVMAKLRPERSVASRWTVAAAGLTIAAGLLVAITPLLRKDGNDRAPAVVTAAAPTKLAVADGQRPNRPLGPVPLVPELLLIASSDERAFKSLAIETGQGLAAVVLYVPGIGGTSGGIIDAESNSAAEPAWAMQMSEGLKPVTESVTETLNVLLRALPVEALASRS